MSIQWTPWSVLYQQRGYPAVDMTGTQLMELWIECVKEDDDEHVDESEGALGTVALSAEGAR